MIKSNKRSNLYNVLLPNWIRLDDSPIGFHGGNTSQTSAGCIRVEDDDTFFDEVERLGRDNVEVLIE